ncbi:hypothetical protein [Halpernia sp.]|uniref:hypothetical protein n=1 Tax=Halpernia sp. TaxID=2782209 RepID=UPI003A90C98D
MKKNLLLLAVSISSFYFSQNIKAITDDGQEVVLLADKTWKFVNESDEKALKTLNENPDVFNKNKSATFLVKSKRLNVGVYINPSKWSFKNATETALEYTFIQKDGNGYALSSANKSDIANYTIYKDIILNSLSKVAAFYRFIESDIRTVNGKKILYVRYKANVDNLDMEFVGYYFISDKGVTQLVCYSSEKRFEEFLPGFMELLNGFVETEEKESKFTSPPPPMTKPKN